MPAIEIADGLTLEQHPQGAIVNYFTSLNQETDVFRVGLSSKSLQACHKALTRNVASWETGDGSLRVLKRDAEIVLLFSS
jgi:hypothetical protein